MTDVGDEVLETCVRNVDANKHLRRLQSESVLVREFDWLQSDLRTGSWLDLHGIGTAAFQRNPREKHRCWEKFSRFTMEMEVSFSGLLQQRNSLL